MLQLETNGLPLYVINYGTRIFMLIDNQLRIDRAIAEVPRLSKQICLSLTRTLAKYTYGKRMPRRIENKCMVICTTAIMWDAFAMLEPKSIRVSLFKLL